MSKYDKIQHPAINFKIKQAEKFSWKGCIGVLLGIGTVGMSAVMLLAAAFACFVWFFIWVLRVAGIGI